MLTSFSPDEDCSNRSARLDPVRVLRACVASGVSLPRVSVLKSRRTSLIIQLFLFRLLVIVYKRVANNCAELIGQVTHYVMSPYPESMNGMYCVTGV